MVYKGIESWNKEGEKKTEGKKQNKGKHRKPFKKYIHVSNSKSAKTKSELYSEIPKPFEAFFIFEYLSDTQFRYILKIFSLSVIPKCFFVLL